MKKFYLTTAIDYVNNLPHIGHAYEKIAADVLARYWRSKKIKVLFQTGTDEHGLKIAKAAKKSPAEFVSQMVSKFEQSWKNLDISYDNFVRTTNPGHQKKVQDYLIKLQKARVIYRGVYSGFYCIGCEEYKTESELEQGRCPIHKKTCEKVSEAVYFFQLSKYQKQIYEIIKSGKLKIEPESRCNEVLSFLKKEKLKDIAISRSRVSWGIPLPWDKKHTIYVWVDALFNYLTGNHSQEYWPADLHIIGKDIIRFHGIIWPAMLLALKLPLPKKIFAHGYLTVSGEKMSKSLGNVIDPDKLVEKYGADAVRYFLLREFSFGADGDFSLARLEERYRADLANDLGNLVQRVLKMVQKYHVKIIAKNNQGLTGVEKDIENLKFKTALDKIWDIVITANQKIDQAEPWNIAKKDPKKLAQFLNQMVSRIILVANTLAPFMPETSKEISIQVQTLKIKPIFAKK